MIAGNAWAYSDDFCRYADKPPVKVCDSEYFGIDALNRLYEAADGSWVCLEVHTDAEFTSLSTTGLGIAELASDERFATPTARAIHDDELEASLAAEFATRPANQWEGALSAVGVGCVEVNMKGRRCSRRTIRSCGRPD